jgi:hypothetical protein
MIEYLDLFIQVFSPIPFIGLIIAVVNWFKMIPGAEKESLNALWPAVAIAVGIAGQIVYVLLIGQPELINMAIAIGSVLGLAAAGLYKFADKLRNG